jgi:putative alpha-1,2-mannosidase
VVIGLDKQYGSGEHFTIVARNSSRSNRYVQSATLNGTILDKFWFRSSELLKGGSLILKMGDRPNYNWGISGYPEKSWNLTLTKLLWTVKTKCPFGHFVLVNRFKQLRLR